MNMSSLNPRSASWEWLAGLVALVAGIGFTLWLMPQAAIMGTGGVWPVALGDDAQSLSMHLAFQNDAWRWPPLYAKSVFWPGGTALSMGDMNPLMSLIAKAMVSVTGGSAINLMGLWFALCFALMPISCAYALRGLAPDLRGPRFVVAAGVAGCLGMMTPALLARLMHLNLCGHFLIVLAIGLSARLMRSPHARGWGWAFAVLMAGVFTHPYVFMLSAAMLGVPVVHDAIVQRRLNRRLLGKTLLVIIAPVLLLTLASGALGGGDKGYAKYSMNLISMFAPQRSGLFGADLPIMDGNGGQYEGFAYLGAGVLLLLALWLTQAPWRRMRAWRGMIAIIAGLFVFALSSRIYLGHVLLLDLGAKPWEDLFAVFRAPGRAAWPVMYVLMLASVAGMARKNMLWAAPVLVIAVGLQWLDTAPLRGDAMRFFAGDATYPALPPLPEAGRLISISPAPGCAHDPVGLAITSPFLLQGARKGMNLGVVGMGRSPKAFNCERMLSDGLEAPMRPGEVRGFTDKAIWGQLSLGVFGGVNCAKTHDIILCGADVGPIAGEAVALRGPQTVPKLADGLTTGPALLPYVSFDWTTDTLDNIWSEGPRTSLLLRLDGARDQMLTISLMGVAFSEGGTRDVVVSLNGVEQLHAPLADMAASELQLAIPAAALRQNIAWVTFDVMRPVDPTRRKLAAPVSRAALRLDGLRLQ